MLCHKWGQPGDLLKTCAIAPNWIVNVVAVLLAQTRHSGEALFVYSINHYSKQLLQEDLWESGITECFPVHYAVVQWDNSGAGRQAFCQGLGQTLLILYRFSDIFF